MWNKEKRKAWLETHRLVLRATRRRSHAKLRAQLVAAYGGRCECCDESEPRFLTLEHKNHDGKKHRQEAGTGEMVYVDLKRRGWPKDGYGLLCYNCNSATRLKEPCPHQIAKGGK